LTLESVMSSRWGCRKRRRMKSGYSRLEVLTVTNIIRIILTNIFGLTYYTYLREIYVSQKKFADDLARSVSITVYQEEGPCGNPPVVWHLDLFFGALPCWTSPSKVLKHKHVPRLTTWNWGSEKTLFYSCSWVLFVAPRERNSSQESFSLFPRLGAFPLALINPTVLVV
jgi:hypothetical protein